MTLTTITRTCLLAGLLLSGSALAETLRMPAPDRDEIRTPVRGEDMQQVLAEFGEPADRLPAVGSPPISRWVYDEFRVYFEHDRVIHSVSR